MALPLQQMPAMGQVPGIDAGGAGADPFADRAGMLRQRLMAAMQNPEVRARVQAAIAQNPQLMQVFQQVMGGGGVNAPAPELIGPPPSQEIDGGFSDEGTNLIGPPPSRQIGGGGLSDEGTEPIGEPPRDRVRPGQQTGTVDVGSRRRPPMADLRNDYGNAAAMDARRSRMQAQRPKPLGQPGRRRRPNPTLGGAYGARPPRPFQAQ